jgi:hypothetical protein
MKHGLTRVTTQRKKVCFDLLPEPVVHIVPPGLVLLFPCTAVLLLLHRRPATLLLRLWYIVLLVDILNSDTTRAGRCIRCAIGVR